MPKDLLSRNHFLDVTCRVIESKIASKKGYSFAINGEWGCGKSWILDSLEERLKSRYLIVRYNCWKHDFYEEPLIALLSDFAQAINAEQSFEYDERERKIKKIAGKVCGDVASKLIKCGSGLDVKAAIKYVNSLRDIAKEERIKLKDVNDKLPIEILIDRIRSDIGTLAALENRGIILMVDELDRCLPDYAIKVLERLHHVCEGTPIVQILTVNKNELTGCIAKAFGFSNPDSAERENFSERYLKKFIDMTINLDNGEIDDDECSLLKDLMCFYEKRDSLNEDVIKVTMNAVLTDVPMRNQVQVIKSLDSIHRLTLAERNESNQKYSYCLLCAELIETMAVVHYGVNNEIYTEGSTHNEIHVALKVSTSSVSTKDFFNFSKRLEELFYVKTYLIDSRFLGNNEKIYAFDWKCDRRAVMTIFLKEDEQNIHFENNFIPDLLKQDQEFFRAFRKNLREFRMR